MKIKVVSGEEKKHHGGGGGHSLGLLSFCGNFLEATLKNTTLTNVSLCKTTFKFTRSRFFLDSAPNHQNIHFFSKILNILQS